MLSYFFESILPQVYDFVIGGGLPADIFKVSSAFIVTVGIRVGIWLICYFFLGFGLHTMAKRRDMKNAYLAFIPFARVYLMGQLVGEISFFGLRIKRIGLIAMIAEIVAFALTVAYDIFYIPLLQDFWTDVFNQASEDYLYDCLEALFGRTMAISAISSIVSLINDLIGFVMLLFLFRNYAPKSSFLFAILALFFDFLGPIFVFAIRKNSCEEYREYMKMKMHSMYGGGNPYSYSDGTYRDPYDLSKDGDKKEEKPESPFGEYDDKNNH